MAFLIGLTIIVALAVAVIILAAFIQSEYNNKK